MSGMSNLKNLGPDGVQGSWMKHLTSMHSNTGSQLEKWIQDKNKPI